MAGQGVRHPLHPEVACATDAADIFRRSSSKSGPSRPLFVFLESGVSKRPMAENIKQTVEARAQELLEPIVAGEGLELLEVEFVREREGWVLRLFIDKPGGRVGLDECSQVSRAVDTVLDVEDIIPHEYNLEVSSPGVNRPAEEARALRAGEGPEGQGEDLRSHRRAAAQELHRDAHRGGGRRHHAWTWKGRATSASPSRTSPRPIWSSSSSSPHTGCALARARPWNLWRR